MRCDIVRSKGTFRIGVAKLVNGASKQTLSFICGHLLLQRKCQVCRGRAEPNHEWQSVNRVDRAVVRVYF
ncbi:hypothetical protein HPP92_014964 [Vanilla planifolia]|uniref:Uncharacterized protein n=1 Tax=Vanilla planifolia TaxID=51239 RepID=A0A835UT79_VANPL|nr:hypothetical protein HPP92_014964 [Vanilla planifolia]